LLTTIVSDQEVYADFEVDEGTYLRFVRSSARTLERECAIPVKLHVGGEDGVLVEGNMHTFDNRIDPSTGAIRARALFSNATGALLSGMFASVELGSSEVRPAVLLSETAILTDRDRKFVYVVGEDGKIVRNWVERSAFELHQRSAGFLHRRCRFLGGRRPSVVSRGSTGSNRPTKDIAGAAQAPMV